LLNACSIGCDFRFLFTRWPRDNSEEFWMSRLPVKVKDQGYVAYASRVAVGPEDRIVLHLVLGGPEVD
jgi:hypothetical protein